MGSYQPQKKCKKSFWMSEIEPQTAVGRPAEGGSRTPKNPSHIIADDVLLTLVSAQTTVPVLHRVGPEVF